MKRIHTILLLSGIFFGMVVYAQPDSTRAYHESWVVKPISGLESFLKYNIQEQQIDSMENAMWLELDNTMRQFDSAYKVPDRSMSGVLFRDNRARMYVDFYKNGKLETGNDSILSAGIGTRCYCMKNKDTVFIKMGVGFFGGFGFEIAVYGNKFQTSYFSYADDALLYKLSPADTAFRESFVLPNRAQYLVLKNKPTSKTGQQLTGYLACTTGDYYEGNGTADSVPARMYAECRLYFTCYVQEAISSAGR